MATTRLSITATPGRPYSFLAKSPSAGEHEGLFTRLGPEALPRQRYSFSAKTPAVPPVGHEGLFTRLSLTATPGIRYSFSAKNAAETRSSPWWSTWRDHTGWNEDAPSLAELVMAGQDRFIEAEPGVVVPAFIPDEAESEEILLEAWGEGGLASISKDVGVDAKGAKNVVRWIAREERKAIIEWRSRLIDDQNLIIMLAMLDD